MEVELIKKELKQLVAEGQNEKALEKLLEHSNSQPASVSDQIFSLSSAYEKLKLDISYGILAKDREQQFNNKLTRRLLGIINLLERPRTPEELAAEQLEKKEEDEKEEEEKSGKKSYAAVFLIGGFLITAFLIYFAISPSGNDKKVPSFSMQDWVGKWEQSIEAGQNVILTGTLTFNVKGKELKGKSKKIYKNGNNSNSELYNIVLDKETSTIKGSWKATDIKSSGTFEFKLKSKNVFKGYYSISPETDKKYYWNGKK